MKMALCCEWPAAYPPREPQGGGCAACTPEAPRQTPGLVPPGRGGFPFCGGHPAEDGSRENSSAAGNFLYSTEDPKSPPRGRPHRAPPSRIACRAPCPWCAADRVCLKRFKVEIGFLKIVVCFLLTFCNTRNNNLYRALIVGHRYCR